MSIVIEERGRLMFKFRLNTVAGDHAHVTVFVKPKGQTTYARSGELRFKWNEWHEFKKLLKGGPSVRYIIEEPEQ